MTARTIAGVIGTRLDRVVYPLVCPRCWLPVLVTGRIHLAEIGPRPTGRPTHWECRAPRHATRPGLLQLTARGRRRRDVILAGTGVGTAAAVIQLAVYLR